MPQFVMNDIQAPAFRALDEFTQGYIQAIFFTDSEPGTTAETHDPETQSSLPGDAGFSDLDAGTLVMIVKDCAEFQTSHDLDLNTVEGYVLDNGNAYTREQAGMDFWYTRCGHGVGFWDRYRMRDRADAIESAFDRLSDAARAKGERWTTYGDDGKVYLS